MPHSFLYLSIDNHLRGLPGGEGIDSFVAARRPGKSWREIADELRELTGVEAHTETVRLWFADRIEVSATVRPEAPASVSS
jgi:hypothetical protein